VATKKIPVQPATIKKPLPVIFKIPVKIKYAILILLAFGFYANTFSNEYALDDEAVIQNNEYVQKGFSGIGKILTSDAYESYYRQNNANQHLAGGRYRPLSIALFAIEHQLWGNSPHKMHVVNVLLFVLCILSIFYFLRNYLFRKLPYGEDLAFISVLLFIIHPLHTEVVANIKSSDEILSLLFIMLTFIFSLKFRESKKIIHLFTGMLCLFLALLAKEYAITLLFLLPLLFMVSLKDEPRKAITRSLPYVGIIVLYFIVRIGFIGFPHQHKDLDVLNNPYLFATPMQKLATEFFVLGKYLWLLVFPYPLAYDYGFAQIPYYSFASPLVWLSILMYVAILYAGIKLWMQKNVFAFPVFFFLFSLFMVSNFFLSIGTTMGERLVFHSSLGFVMFCSYGIMYATKKMKLPQRSYIIGSVLSVIIIICGAETINRNNDWKNNFTLFTKDIAVIPKSVKANDNAGAQYINLSEATKDTARSDSIAHVGLKFLYKAVHLDDSDIDGYLNLGIAYCQLIEPDSAKVFWDKAKAIYPAQANLPGYYSLLGQIFNYTGNKFVRQGKVMQAIHEFEIGVQCNPSNSDLWYNLGGTFFNSNQYDSARNAWLKVYQLNPNYRNIQQCLGMLPKGA
jgi:protein O-mannosyl-transferase